MTTSPEHYDKFTTRAGDWIYGEPSGWTLTVPHTHPEWGEGITLVRTVKQLFQYLGAPYDEDGFPALERFLATNKQVPFMPVELRIDLMEHGFLAPIEFSERTVMQQIRGLVKSLYSPDQPREPAGSPEGGEWAGGSGGGGHENPMQAGAWDGRGGSRTKVTPPTDAERESIMYYGSTLYDDINEPLREGKGLDDMELSEHAHRLDAVIARNTIPVDTIYRGLSFSEEEINDMLVPGTVIEDKGFTSTTTDVQIAGKFSEPAWYGKPKDTRSIIMEIKVPAGSTGLYVPDAVSSELAKQEQEVLLPRGSKFKITKVSHYGDNYTAYMELMPHA